MGTWAIAKSKQRKKKKEKKGLKDKAEKALKKVSKSVEVEMDRMLNSPSATVSLLSNDSDDEDVFPTKKKKKLNKNKLKESAEKVSEVGMKLGRSLSDSVLREPGYLLKLGEKFQSQDSFLRFMGLPGKSKKNKKRKLSDDATDEPEVTGDLKSDAEKGGQTELEPVPPPRKKKKAGLDVGKLRELLGETEEGQVSSVNTVHKTLAEEARVKLTASRFRFLNEKLYTQESNASVKLFRSDPTLFGLYHQGYQHQAKQWPLDPLNVIMTDILRQKSSLVIADLGCGEARLARSVPNTVHSYDLVAVNDTVTVADISNLPLEDGSVDMVVFCLSLMGTNLRDFIFEAGRILKVGGVLKIAELESRFQGEGLDVESFIAAVQKFGFKNTWKDLKKDFFYFLDFNKVVNVKKKKKLPDINLKACLYKKR